MDLEDLEDMEAFTFVLFLYMMSSCYLVAQPCPDPACRLLR